MRKLGQSGEHQGVEFLGFALGGGQFPGWGFGMIGWARMECIQLRWWILTLECRWTGVLDGFYVWWRKS